LPKRSTAQLDYKTQSGLSDYMGKMLSYWITTYDVDGFRFDTADRPFGDTRMITKDFWQGLRPQLESAKPGVILLGEAEDPDLSLAPFDVDYGWHSQGLYGLGGLKSVANGGDLDNLKKEWEWEQTAFPAGMLHMNMLQNWDLDQDFKLYGGVANTRAAAVFNFTSKGVPLLFNGEEVGNDNSSVNTVAPINWGGSNAASFKPFYKALLSLRNANTALQQGKMEWATTTPSNHIVSFTRSDASGTFLVIINFSPDTVTGSVSASAAGGWSEVTPDGSPGGNTHVAPPSFSLKAYDYAVFRAN
jgi:glycosidase